MTVESARTNPIDFQRSLSEGYCLIPQAVEFSRIEELRNECEKAFAGSEADVRARSSKGVVYAARNVIHAFPLVKTFWTHGVLLDLLRAHLGDDLGLVRVLFFDKPPCRSWALPWHKDTAIAVRDNSLPSSVFTRPTVKAGVPHVVAPDVLLRRMLTLRVHLDDVTDENGPLQVVPESHVSNSSEGRGVAAAVTIHAAAGDVLAMRPLISHASAASKLDTVQHRRILHLEFAADRDLSDGYQWHDFVPACVQGNASAIP